MMKFSKTKMYNVPGSYSLGEAYTVALISYIQNNPMLLTRVTNGTGKLEVLIERYKKAAEKYYGQVVNGVYFMTFGILWEELGSELIGKEKALEVEERMVMQIDFFDSDAGWLPLKDISILIEKAGLDKPYKTVNTDFTRKMRSFKKMIANDFDPIVASQLQADAGAV